MLLRCVKTVFEHGEIDRAKTKGAGLFSETERDRKETPLVACPDYVRGEISEITFRP